MPGADRGSDFDDLAVVTAPPSDRSAIGRPQAALDLNGRREFMNQKMNAGSEGLAQVEQVEHDRHQDAVAVQIRSAYGTQKLGHVVDFPPVDHDRFELLYSNSRHCRRTVFEYSVAHAKRLESTGNCADILGFAAQNQRMHFHRCLAVLVGHRIPPTGRQLLRFPFEGSGLLLPVHVIGGPGGASSALVATGVFRLVTCVCEWG
jgi:hypothetical protein